MALTKINSSDFVYAKTSIDGCYLVRNQPSFDIRGSFEKIYPLNSQLNLEGINNIMQVNISTNDTAGTVRGLHFQSEPNGEYKLIRCILGSVYDVVLDVRPHSPTYGQHVSFILNSNSPSVLISPCIAHGYQTLEDNTQLMYLHSREFSSKSDTGVYALDRMIGIKWPLEVKNMSSKDKNLPSWDSYASLT